MICPKCACDETKVIKTVKSLTVFRWRKCARCGYMWITEEKPKGDKELVDYVAELNERERENDQ